MALSFPFIRYILQRYNNYFTFANPYALFLFYTLHFFKKFAETEKKSYLCTRFFKESKTNWVI